MSASQILAKAKEQKRAKQGARSVSTMKRSKPSRNAPATLTEMEVQQWIVTPRAAIDVLYASGRIGEYEVGSLQCLIVMLDRVAERTGIAAPDSRHVRGLIGQIEARLPILEERIDKARDWLFAATQYLRSAPRAEMSSILRGLQIQCEMSPGTTWEG